MLAGLILLVLVGFGLAGPGFLSFANLVSIGQQTAVIAIVGFAMTAVIIARGIDISVGSTLAIAGIVAGRGLCAPPVRRRSASSPRAGARGRRRARSAAPLISAVGIGPFIATLATHWPAARGGARPVRRLRASRSTAPSCCGRAAADILGVPASLLLAACCSPAGGRCCTRTVFGRWIFAVGGNAGAARASLIPVRTTRRP